MTQMFTLGNVGRCLSKLFSEDLPFSFRSSEVSSRVFCVGWEISYNFLYTPFPISTTFLSLRWGPYIFWSGQKEEYVSTVNRRVLPTYTLTKDGTWTPVPTDTLTRPPVSAVLPSSIPSVGTPPSSLTRDAERGRSHRGTVCAPTGSEREYTRKPKTTTTYELRPNHV